MCYSARVRQNFDHLSRRYDAEVDWEAFADIYMRRAQGEDLKMSRDLQRNFQHPSTETQKRTAGYIAQFLREKKQQWENEVFVQRRRLVVAEESLQKRETKKAREDIRIATKKMQEHLDRLTDLRRTEPNKEDARIFPSGIRLFSLKNRANVSSDLCATPAVWRANPPIMTNVFPELTTRGATVWMTIGVKCLVGSMRSWSSADSTRTCRRRLPAS